MPQTAGLEIDKPLRVKGVAHIPHLEVKMCAGRAACGAAKTDDIPGLYPVSRDDIALRKMALECLESVLMPDNHQIAVAAEIFRNPDLAGKCGLDRSPHR